MKTPTEKNKAFQISIDSLTGEATHRELIQQKLEDLVDIDNSVILIWESSQLKEGGPSEESFQYLGSGYEVIYGDFKEKYITDYIEGSKEEDRIENEARIKNGEEPCRDIQNDELREYAVEEYENLQFFKYKGTVDNTEIEAITAKTDVMWSPDYIIEKGNAYYSRGGIAKDDEGRIVGILL